MLVQVHQLEEKYHFGGDVDIGGQFGGRGTGNIYNITVPSLRFCYKPKTALIKS